MSAANLQHLALLKFGINVPLQQREQVIKLIKSNPNYKDDFQSIKNNIKTMIDEDQFLDTIHSSHVKISEIQQNNKVIQQREHTFQIRAINPDHIQSLTERAFFNSFNLQRIVLNDLEEENFYQAQKCKGEDQRKEKDIKRIPGNPEKQEQVQKQIKRSGANVNENEEEQKCICGKVIQQSYWIQCSNEGKCRGSSWYHLECAGIKVRPQDMQHLDFICEYCKRPQEEEKESESSNKKFKTNNG